MNIIGGYIFDIFGRKITLFVLNFLCGLIICLMPWTSPNQNYYVIASVALNLVMTPIAYSPIIQDCSQKESLGKAVALSMLGSNLGVIISLLILFHFTINLDP